MSQRELPKELTDFISQVLDTFTEEAKRLNDPSVLCESRDLLHFYFACRKQLGGIEHEVAVRALNEHIEIAHREARTNRSSIWRRFWARRRRRKSFQIAPAITTAIADVRDFDFGDSDDNDPEKQTRLREMQTQLQKVVQAVDAAIASQKQGDKLSRELELALLAFDVRMHMGTYTRLGVQRLVSFIGKHTFIILVPVLLLGIGYSWLVRQSQTLLVNGLSLGLWGAFALLVVAGLFKEYVVAKRLKTLRLRAERWLLLPVVDHVLRARLHGLISATLDRQPLKG